MPGFSRSQNCTVTALTRRTIAAARQSAAEYGIPLAFGSVAELCNAPEVDAVLVTTPNSCHLSDVLAAVKAGKHVLCEKPMGMNAAQCRQMVKAARDRNVVLGVAHVFRFEESILKLRELLAAGRIGAPVFARCEFSFFAGPHHARTWLHDASLAGAGPIFDIGVHCIDTLRFVLQDEVVRVSCTASSDARSGDVESAASLTLEFAKGTIEIVGQTGVLSSENALTVEHPVEVQLRHDGKVIESAGLSNTNAYTLQVDAFADAIEGKSPFPIPGEDGWQNQEILDAALRSMKSGATETVPLDGC